jgi:hypothetical protein
MTAPHAVRKVFAGRQGRSSGGQLVKPELDAARHRLT